MGSLIDSVRMKLLHTGNAIKIFYFGTFYDVIYLMERMSNISKYIL